MLLPQDAVVFERGRNGLDETASKGHLRGRQVTLVIYTPTLSEGCTHYADIRRRRRQQGNCNEGK